MQQKIKAYDSVKIDKLLEQVKNTIVKYDNYYFTDNPLETLKIMKAEIDNIFSYIIEEE